VEAIKVIFSLMAQSQTSPDFVSILLP